MLLKLKRTPGIYLTGFMGSGKSEVGRLLAHELGWSFVDLDAEIEASEGVSIAEIFDTRGEEEFRKIERETLQRHVREIERGKPVVIAMGGGAYVPEATRHMLHDRGVAIWLDCPFERVCARLKGSNHRPLARDPERFRQLYHDRREAYGHADYRIEADTDDPGSLVAAILALGIF